MKKIGLLAFTFFTSCNLGLSQDNLLGKLKSGRLEIEEVAKSWVTELFLYMNIMLVFIIIYWAISAFRASRAHQDDEDRNFSVIKFATPKAAMLIVYALLQVLAKSIL